MTLLSEGALTPLRRMDMHISETRFGGQGFQPVRLVLLWMFMGQSGYRLIDVYGCGNLVMISGTG